MHDALTTALDVVALLGVAVGLYCAAAPWIGGAALIPAGLLVGTVSAYWAQRTRARNDVRS